MLLQTIYLELLDHSATRIGELFAALAADGGTPAVFHCHAGKDRTGLVAGVLLEALGVGRETVLDDYELTSRYRLRAQQDSSYERLIETGLSPEAAAGVLTTPRWAMQAALASLDDDHGGPATWLTEVAGLRPGELAALRARLLAPPGS
jgi:protein-tyrosine phosphatase